MRTSLAVTHDVTAALDVSSLPAALRDGTVLAAFDHLGAGETLRVVSAAAAPELLDLLQEQRKGLFEWSPLGEKPGRCEVEIARRLAVPGALRSVTEALEWDHDRLDRLGINALQAFRAGDLDAARRLCAAFHQGLDRHMRFEEQLLFPVFEMRTGLPHRGPTYVMRAEHRDIRAAVGDLCRALQNGDPTLEEQHRALRELIHEHNRKEEAILYPGTDRLLSAAESDALVARVQAFPA
jgi:hemerythrin-like domain-containing protein/uncharacterized protein (DUF2249 family)